MFKATNPENTAIVDRLADLLEKLPVDGEIAYLTLNEAARRDVSRRSRYLLQKAVAQAEANQGCIYECIRSIGIKRLSAEAGPDVGLSCIRSVRRKANRGARRLGRIQSNSLPDGIRKRTIAYSAMLGAISMLADGNKARTVAAVADPSKPIPPVDILSIFVRKPAENAA